MDRRYKAFVHQNDWQQSGKVNKRGFTNGAFLLPASTGLTRVQVYIGIGDGADDQTPPENWAGARYADGSLMVFAVDAGLHIPMPKELAAASWILFGPYGDDTPGEVICQFSE